MGPVAGRIALSETIFTFAFVSILLSLLFLSFKIELEETFADKIGIF